jgi:hypothetical protein
VKTTVGNVLLSCLLLAPLAHAAEPVPPNDQVVVQATRANLARLAEEVKKAEYRFYQRYNELNTKRDYAIQCTTEARPNSRFTNSSCKPLFQTKAEEDESREFFMELSRQYSAAGVPAPVAVAAGRPAYQKNVLEVTKRSPDLSRLLGEHNRLLRQYEALYYRVNRLPQQPAETAAPAAPASAK